MHTDPVKSLRVILPKQSGRDSSGHVSMRHQGGRHKRFLRLIDWKRDKDGVPGKVISIEYDPNRSADIALIQYRDGSKRYILAPSTITVGQMVLSGNTVDIMPGNALQLKHIPVGTFVHGIEIKPGKGAQMARSAGTAAMVVANDGITVQLKLPSGELRIFDANSRATVGQVGNVDWKNRIIGKAGRARNMGRRPTVRGVAQNPRSHPHGGGEGRSGIGLKSPKSPWGKRTLGKKTRSKKKYSNAYILTRRT